MIFKIGESKTKKIKIKQGPKLQLNQNNIKYLFTNLYLNSTWLNNFCNIFYV